jgi:hypothetical protein
MTRRYLRGKDTLDSGEWESVPDETERVDSTVCGRGIGAGVAEENSHTARMLWSKLSEIVDNVIYRNPKVQLRRVMG